MTSQATRKRDMRNRGKQATLARRQQRRIRQAQEQDAGAALAVLLASRPGTGQVQAY